MKHATHPPPGSIFVAHVPAGTTFTEHRKRLIALHPDRPPCWVTLSGLREITPAEIDSDLVITLRHTQPQRDLIGG
ncbi:MAG TPA: hypothetical protein VJ890_21610 [Vineibacter sp.]|nr:hypothetical protein [Vineibacter sp.]